MSIELRVRLVAGILVTLWSTVFAVGFVNQHEINYTAHGHHHGTGSSHTGTTKG